MIRAKNERLLQWHSLCKRQSSLKRTIQNQKDYLTKLKDRTSKDDILSSITQKYDRFDMPKGKGGHGDSVGNMVANAMQKIEEAEAQLALFEAELVTVEMALSSIEMDVAMLSERKQRFLTMYFKDGISIQKICSEMFMGDSQVYRVLASAVRDFEKWSQPIKEIVGVGKVAEG